MKQIRDVEDLCRNCDHKHVPYSGCSGIELYGRRFSCLCPWEYWAPKDNLQYLEYVYDKSNSL